MAWLRGYTKRIPIVVNSDYIRSTLNNFPILITDSVISDEVWQYINREDIGDIRITSDDGQTVLMAEWSVASKAAESLSLFFNSGLLTEDEDTTFYLYAGHDSNEQMTQEEQESVWSGYTAVWHMEETGTYIDSTENDNDGIGYVGSTNKMGKIKQGQFFSGNDYIDIPDFGKTAGFSVSMWVNPDNKTNTDVIISNTTGFSIGTYSSGPSLILAPDGFPKRRASSADITNGAWNHLVCSYDQSGIPSCFINGVEASYLSENEWNNPGSFIGQRLSGLSRYNGYIDEIRIMDSQTNIDWVYAEYINQNNITNFFTVGEIERVYPNYYHSTILNRIGRI